MKRLLLFAALVMAGLAGYVGVAKAIAVPNLSPYEGYFHHKYEYFGTFVLPVTSSGEAIPFSINSATEFINFVEDDLHHGTTQERVGAAFIIQTMLGGTSRTLPPSNAQVSDWESRVRYSASHGLVNWNKTISYSTNSFYQKGNKDDAFFYDSGSDPAILFYDSSHSRVLYAIKHRCANPVGSVDAIVKGSQYTFSGRSTVSSSSAAPGTAVTFSHYVKNQGPDTASTSWKTHNVTTGATVASGSVNLTSGKESKVSTENFTIPLTATAGTKYCRYISFSPHDEGGGSGSGSQVCVTVVAAFELHPYVDSDVSVVDPGGKITFTYTVHNADPTASGSVTCKPVGNTRGAGYTPLPEQDVDRTSDAGYAPPATSCPRTFAGGSSVDVATETFTVGAVPPGNSVCRSLVINPKNASGGFRASAEACVVVAAKPYVKIFGGDMSAGNQQTVNGACSAADGTDDGSILSWNLGAASSYAGAGAQYAALALGQITDFSSTQDNAAGSAPEPSGLAFSNQNIAAGTFGGNFGSLPCVPDYYSLKPATTAPLDSNLSNLSTSGAYSATGPISIGGNINPNNRIQAYVDGDVYITGDINYPGSWSVDHSPMFELVVQGNIYIDKNVQNLQGIFIAQPDAAGAGGTIYTCATSAAPIDTDSPTYYSDCKNKLTISGAFSANQIQLLRTHGTVADSTTDSALAATSNAAEQFSYNPLAWLAQPQTSSGTATAGNYDAITTLPPIL